MGELRCHFFTKQEAYACDDAVLSISGLFGREKMGTIINSMLGRSGEEALAFEFVWAGKLVQNSLVQHAALHAISKEEVAEIEYFASAPEPRYAGAPDTPNDEWIGALCVAGGSRVLAGTYGGSVFDGSGACVAEHAHDGCVTAACSDASERVATVGKDAIVRLWRSVGTCGPLVAGVSGEAHAHAVDSCCFLGDRLVTGDWGGMVFLWAPPRVDDDGERASKKARAAPFAPLLTHKAHAQCASALAPMDDAKLFTASWDHAVKLWDAERMEPLSSGNASVVLTCLDYSTALNAVAAGAHDGSVHLLDDRAKTGTPFAKRLSAHSNRSVTSLKWAPSGNDHHLASCAQDGMVNLWDVRSSPHAPVATMDAPEVDKCLALAWTPDGHIYVAGDNSSVHKFDL